MSDLISRRKLVHSGLVFGAGVAGATMLGSGARAQSAAGGKLTPTKIANASGNLNLAMQALMVQQGYMQDFGLDPNFESVADGSKILAGLVAGDLDSSMMSGFGQTFPAIEKGAKIKILAGAALPPSLTLYSSKPAIKSIKDLEGKIIGTGPIGALLYQLTVALLRKNNVDTSNIRFVNIGSSGDVFRATTVGTIDAGTGETGLLDNIAKYKVHPLEGGNMTTGLTEYTYQGAWTTDNVIAKKRDVLVRTLAAHAKLYRFVQTAGAKDAFLKARAVALPKSDPQDAQDDWDYIQKYKPFTETLVLSQERLDYMQQLNIDLKVQSKIMPFDQVADMSIAQDAIKLLG